MSRRRWKRMDISEVGMVGPDADKRVRAHVVVLDFRCVH